MFLIRMTAGNWQHAPACEAGRQQKLPGKMRARFLATAGPRLGSLEHVSGDGAGEGNGGTFLQICLVREIERINLEFLAPGGALLSGGSLLPVLIDAQSPDLGFQSLAWYPEFRGCSCRSGNPSMGPGESSFDHLHFTIFECR